MNKKNNINLENQDLKEDKNINQNNNSNNKSSKNIKNYEHKTISFFNDKNTSNNNVENMKITRNKLFKIKKKALIYPNKENEFIIKEKNKEKYRLDLIKNIKKNELNDDEVKIIKIKDNEDNEESNSDEDNNNDMTKFRKAIGFFNSKYNKRNGKIKENNGYIIYDTLLNNQKINKDKK